MITREFKLYLNAGVGVAPVINANQFDQSEEWVFTLLQSDGTVYTPSTGAIIGLKQDGTTILNAGTVNESGQVVITETEQITAVPGSNLFEILIDGNSHGTANFVVFVERRPGDIDNPSESDISLFQEAIEAAGNVTQFQTDIANLQSNVDDLETGLAQETSQRQTQDAVLSARVDEAVTAVGETGETVLFEDTTTTLWYTGQTITLSESYKNFDYLDFYVQNLGREKIYRYAPDTTTILLRSVNLVDSDTDISMRMYETIVNLDSQSPYTTVTCSHAWSVVWSGNSATNAERILYTESSGLQSSSLQIYKIVGVKLCATNPEVTDIRVGADGTTYPSAGDAVRGQYSDLKNALSSAIDGGYNAYDTLQLSGSNSAVTSNGDGTYTVGTSDYGTSLFGSATLLKAGVYFLFGVPQGFSFLSTTNSHNEAIFTNDGSEPKWIVLESDTTLYLGFRVAQKPNTSFVIRPFLYSTKVKENARDIKRASADLFKYNSMNLMDTSYAISRTNNGITFTWNLDKTQCLVSGTSTGTASCAIYDNNNALPYGIEAGKTYIVVHHSNYVSFNLYWYNSSGDYISNNYFGRNGMFTVPSDAIGAYIRLDVASGLTVNETVDAPAVLNSYSNDMLNDLMIKNSKEITADQYASCNDITESSILFVSSTSGNLYIPDFVYVGWLQTIPVNSNIILQVAYPYNSNDVIKMRVKTVVDGWTSWRAVAGGTTTITQEVNRDTYQNTYNITTSPQITTDSNGWLQPVDANTADETNKTDMTGAIMSMLTSTGYCHLAPGIYYVSGNIDMPADSMLEGCGKQTIIRLFQSTTSGYIVRMHTRSTVKNVCFSGSYSTGSISDGNIGGRRGINYIGNRDGQSTGITPKTCTCCVIEGCFFENLDSGIYGYNAGGGLQEGLICNNCYFTRCKAGINLDYWVEYSKFTNCITFQCYYGCINNGGNNVFTACTFHGVIGFLIDNSSGSKSNVAHGTVNGCTFNHIDNMNNPDELGKGIAIKVLNATVGFIFANCQLWYGRVHIESSTGIQITGCEFGGLGGASYPAIETSGNGMVFVDNCLFQTTPALSMSSPSKITNCWTYNGVAVTA